MVDAVVSSVLDLLKTTIIDRGREEAELLVGVEDQVEKLKTNLLLIRTVLADAEEKKATNDLVKEWLVRLKDAAYDMEDALDEWRIAVEMELQGPQKVPCNVMSCFSFRRVGLRREIALNIREINQRLDEIVRDIDRYQLMKKSFELPDQERGIKLPKQPESSSFVVVSSLVGRDGVKREILHHLWGGNGKEEIGELIPTISIVGMGGLGKTALAQLVCNDHDVKQHFDSVIWVCVSDHFDEKMVAKAIIQKLEQLSDIAAFGLESNPLQVLLERISNSIKGKKFLLILDDVWDGDKGERWDSLKVTFKHGALGSRILVTTRDVRVATMMGSSSHQIISLEKLGEEECWQILSHIAFKGRDKKTCENLEEIGRKIANRCKGLPLAAKTLGSLLQSKIKRVEWQSVLNNDIWKLDLVQKDIFAPLLLSYYDLPPTVRRCFLFCVLYPKDHEYWKHYLTLHWMAQGYLGFNVGDADLESIGDDYYDLLVARSFFEDITGAGVLKVCKMHDLVHDFGLYLVGDEFATKELVESDHTIDATKHRHLMVKAHGMSLPSSISGAEKLRTLLVFVKDGVLSREAMRSVFNKCKRLRLLDCGWSRNDSNVSLCKEIPTEIGKLMHLRSLSLDSHSQLEELPEGLSKLRNLEYLCLNNCQNLKELPVWITKLINLRYLGTAGCFALTPYPKYIRELVSLRSLIGCIARADCNDSEKFSLSDLGNLQHLRRVAMKVMGDSIDKEEARQAQLPNIRDLQMYLVGNIGEDEITEALHLPADVTLRFYHHFWMS